MFPGGYFLFGILLVSYHVAEISGRRDAAVMFGPGNCPEIPGKENFSMEKFQKVWYPGFQFLRYLNMFSSCQILNFTAISEHQMTLTLDNLVSRNLKLKTAATISTPDRKNPGVMQLSWNLAPAVNEIFTVVDTDYRTYAGATFCQDWGLFYKMAPMILTTSNDDLSSSVITRVTKLLDPALDLSNVYPSGRQFKCYRETNTTVKNEVDFDYVFQSVSDFLGKFTHS